MVGWSKFPVQGKRWLDASDATARIRRAATGKETSHAYMARRAGPSRAEYI
jgi:hypothetical protein